MKPLYLVCGVSGAGKSWVCRQLTDKFHYIPHDRCWVHPDHKTWKGADAGEADMQDESRYFNGAKSNHLEVLLEAVKSAKKPVITECPFGERPLKEQLEAHGVKVIPYFVVEPVTTVMKRYQGREKKPLPAAAVTRAQSIINRVVEWGAPYGSSDDILNKLKHVHV